MNFDPRRHAVHLVVQALSEPGELAAAAGEDDVREQLLAQVRVARRQRGGDELRERLRDAAGRRVRARELGPVVEEELADLQALRAEERVLPRRELVRARGARQRRAADASAAAGAIGTGTDCSFHATSRHPAMLCVQSSTSRASAHACHDGVVCARRSSRTAKFGICPISVI
jgi:hypothetical protein